MIKYVCDLCEAPIQSYSTGHPFGQQYPAPHDIGWCPDCKAAYADWKASRKATLLAIAASDHHECQKPLGIPADEMTPVEKARYFGVPLLSEPALLVPVVAVCWCGAVIRQSEKHDH